MAFILALVAIGVPASASAPVEQQAIESPYVVEQYVEYTPPKVYVRPQNWNILCSCLLFFKQERGITQILYYPNRMSPASQTPFIGAGVLLREGAVGHIAVVREITATHIKIAETNFYRCRYSERWLALDYWAIRGYY